ncbi:MAG: cyclic nucleotide-binding domain-containing protein [Myxococcota bacterium]
MEKYIKHHQAGTVLFEEGDPGNEMFVIQSGRVRLSKRVFRTEIVVEELSKGEFCGELSLVMKTTRPVTATVTQDAQLLVVSSTNFEAMIQQNSSIMFQMLKRLATRMTRAHFRLSNFALRRPMARLLHQLRAEWKAASLKGAEGVPYVPDNLCDALGLEPAELDQIIQKAVADRLISIDREGIFRITNREAYDRLLMYLELHDRFEFMEV